MKRILLFASAVAVMFSSCSKDTTEVASLDGAKGVISATLDYEYDATTRTYLGESTANGRPVLWSQGDALGVFGSATTDIQTQFGLVSGAGESSATFDGNTHYLTAGEAVYAYYPFTKKTSISEGKVDLEIAKTQTYKEHAIGTFDAAQAPAVAYVEKADLAALSFKMKGVASYLAFPIKGVGTVEYATLTIGDCNLAGIGSVDIAAENPVLELTTETEKELKLACSGVVLNPITSKWIVFVVPAGVDTNQNDVRLTIKLEGKDAITHTRKGDANKDENPTQVHKVRKMAYDPASQDVNGAAAWSFGLEGTITITNEVEFLKYAYMVQPGQNHLDFDGTTFSLKQNASEAQRPSAEDYNYMLSAGYIDANVNTTAWIYAESLDFENYGAEWATIEYNNLQRQFTDLNPAVPTAEQKFMLNFYKWVADNDGIKSLAYNAVVGAGYDKDGIANGKATTIKNLNVKGNGFTVGASLKNLVLERITIDGSDVYVGLVASKNDIVVTNGANVDVPMTINDVTIGIGNTVKNSKGSASYTGGIYGKFTDKQDVARANVVAGAAEISIDAPNTNNGLLYGYYVPKKQATISLANYAINTTVCPTLIGEIGSHSSGAVLVVDKKISAGENAGVVPVGKVGDKVSIIADDTAYWNGYTYEPNTDGYYTAEELAYELKAITAVDIELAYNYDMQSIEFALPKYNTTGGNGTKTISGEKTISNLVATVDGESNSYYATLFGENAVLTGVTLKNIFINVPARQNGYAYNGLAGLAVTGTVSDVTVDGLTLNIAEDVNATGDQLIGGLFSTATLDTFAGSLTVNNVVVNNFVGATAGVVAAVFEVTESGQKLQNLTVTASNVAESSNYLKRKNADDAKEFLKKASAYSNKRIPFGALSVAAAEWKNNLVQTFDVENCNYGERIAASIWFPESFLGADAVNVNAVELDTIVNSDYVFKSNANAGTSTYMNQIGFEKKL